VEIDGPNKQQKKKWNEVHAPAIGLPKLLANASLQDQ
jgi:hypothetical protein